MGRQLPIEIFMPPNILKAKVGSVAGGIDVAAIRRAEAAVETLKVEFNDWLAHDVARLGACRDRFAGGATAEARDDLFRAAHDLKGQAETFGYPMIARLAGSLAKLLDAANGLRQVPLALVDAHVDAVRVVFRDKIKTSGDRVAMVLSVELEARVNDVLP